MNITFNEAVEVIQGLSLEEKEEIKTLLEKSITEQTRDEIYKNCLKSRKEHKKGRMKFSDNLKELKAMVEK